MARDTKDHAEDLDGFRRNVREYIDDAEGVIEHVKAENAKGTHDPFMNTLTEAARKDPKWAMHTVVLVIVAAALIAGGIFALVAFG